jgi:hypothetical protein
MSRVNLSSERGTPETRNLFFSGVLLPATSAFMNPAASGAPSLLRLCLANTLFLAMTGRKTLYEFIKFSYRTHILAETVLLVLLGNHAGQPVQCFQIRR